MYRSDQWAGHYAEIDPAQQGLQIGDGESRKSSVKRRGGVVANPYKVSVLITLDSLVVTCQSRSLSIKIRHRADQ
jgi:hypothetical protein